MTSHNQVELRFSLPEESTATVNDVKNHAQTVLPKFGATRGIEFTMDGREVIARISASEEGLPNALPEIQNTMRERFVGITVKAA